MGTTLLHRMMPIALMVSCLALNWVSSSSLHNQKLEKGESGDEICPPCELLFSKLENTGRAGKLRQLVKVQERGEPKSGTGVMYFWTTAALMHACDYLRELYGEGSCRVEFNKGEMKDGAPVDRTYNRSMIFEPALGDSNSRCSCETIERVAIVTSKLQKHMLPVKDTCAYSHSGGMDLAITDRYSGKTACTFADGSKVENQDDLWRCMHQANCDIHDRWLQMAVFRDPRPAVVSSYYHREVQGSKHLGEFEAFVVRELPILCQWLAIRYTLFCGLVPHQSMAFWYDDAMSDPLQWHYHWFYSVGLQLPPHIVQAATKAAVADNLGFRHKDIDVHPGETPTNETGVRRFEDEVSPEMAALADAVLRVWLPPVLLDKLGVAP